jgi:hypothetical protein
MTGAVLALPGLRGASPQAFEVSALAGGLIGTSGLSPDRSDPVEEAGEASVPRFAS